jgi:hypothetical protein
VAFKILYVYDFSTKLCGRKVDVTRNHENENFCDTGRGETQHRKFKKVKLGGRQATQISLTAKVKHVKV